jgi:putative beta-lysine N-acetyltransferase
VADLLTGELVLDPRNKRLKLYGVPAEHNRNPGIAFWKEGLDLCPDVYSKLLVYGKGGTEPQWVTAGFLFEGVIEGYFADGSDGQIWAAYGDNERSDAPHDALHDQTVLLASRKEVVRPDEPAPGFSSRLATDKHAQAIATLMLQTFEDYPTPISEEIIAGQIRTGSNLFRVMLDARGEVVASASAEVDAQNLCAEMTDCATRPDQRGAGHMAHLLHRLAQDVKDVCQITDLYTLARADEVGMNCVFAKLGYEYTGRLTNNCRMPNGWESMNIWCKNTARRGQAAAATP